MSPCARSPSPSSREPPSPGSRASAGRSSTARRSPPASLRPSASDYGQVVLAQRLRDALARLNPALPAEALEDAFRKLTRPEGPTLEARNRAVHRLLVDGVTVEYRPQDGSIRGAQARVIDFDDADNNDWLAVNQFTVSREQAHAASGRGAVRQRPAAGAHRAEERRRRERDDLDRLPTAPDVQGRGPVALRLQRICWSSPTASRRGSARLRRGREWFKPWRTIAGERLADPHLPELQVVLEGLFEKRRLPRPDPRLHRVRGRRQRRAGQEDGGLPPVPRGASGGGGDAAGGRAAPRSRPGRRGHG